VLLLSTALTLRFVAGPLMVNPPFPVVRVRKKVVPFCIYVVVNTTLTLAVGIPAGELALKVSAFVGSN